MSGKAIIYKGLIDVHFSDLDFYGHVNSKHYIDYVSEDADLIKYII
jgi:hypothetical protein